MVVAHGITVRPGARAVNRPKAREWPVQEHENQFSRRRLSGRSPFSQPPFAATRGNEQDAPKAVVALALNTSEDSTDGGH